MTTQFFKIGGQDVYLQKGAHPGQYIVCAASDNKEYNKYLIQLIKHDLAAKAEIPPENMIWLLPARDAFMLNKADDTAYDRITVRLQRLGQQDKLPDETALKTYIRLRKAHRKEGDEYFVDRVREDKIRPYYEAAQAFLLGEKDISLTTAEQEKLMDYLKKALDRQKG